MQIKAGDIFEGKVSKITTFGAFVDLAEGGSGMVHISEISNDYVNAVADYLSVGQEVKVKVLKVEDGKVSLSIKKADPNNRPPQRQFKPNNFRGNNNDNRGGFSQRQKPKEQSFEDMMAKFKQTSDERMSDVKKSYDSKRSGNAKRSGSGSFRP